MNIKHSFFKYHKWLLMAAGSWHLKLKNPLLNFLYKIYALLLYNISILMVQNVLVSVVIYRKCPLRLMELTCYYVQYTNVLVMSYLSKTNKMKRVRTKTSSINLLLGVVHFLFKSRSTVVKTDLWAYSLTRVFESTQLNCSYLKNVKRF